MYKKQTITEKDIEVGVHRLSDNAFIPFALDNTDYQAYLAWVAEGNAPLPADEVTA